MRKILTFLMMLLLAGWLLAGCSSEETAPNDPLPELTDEDVAHQSGYMAMALVEMAPVSLEFSGKADASDGRYLYTFIDDEIQGEVQLYFEQNDAPSGYDVADFAQAWTGDEAPLLLYPIEGGIAWLLAFSLESIIDQGAGTAVIGGAGSLILGNYEALFTVVGLAIERGGDWPAGGYMTFTNEGIPATVTFDGDSTAIVSIGELSWILNLSNGTLTEL